MKFYLEDCFEIPLTRESSTSFLWMACWHFVMLLQGLDLANDRDDGCFCARIEFLELDVTIYDDMSVFYQQLHA